MWFNGGSSFLDAIVDSLTIRSVARDIIDILFDFVSVDITLIPESLGAKHEELAVEVVFPSA